MRRGLAGLSMLSWAGKESAPGEGQALRREQAALYQTWKADPGAGRGMGICHTIGLRHSHTTEKQRP